MASCESEGRPGLMSPGVPHSDGPRDVFLHDGRQLGNAGNYERSIEDRGFCLVSGTPTSLPKAAFSEHFTKKAHKGICQTFTFSGSDPVPGRMRCFTLTADGPTTLESSKATEAISLYQQETAKAVKKAFPRAELLLAYNQVVRSTRGQAAASSPASGAQDAGNIAATIRKQAQMVHYYPEDARSRTKKMLVDDDDESGYLDSLITYHSCTAPYAAMAGASTELQAQVREALPEQDFIATMKRLLCGEDAAADPMLEFRSREDGSFEPPALGVHTDITEKAAVKQLEQLAGSTAATLQALHSFRADRYAVYHLNLWRNIDPEVDIRNFHLAVLDQSSVAKEDAIPRDITFDGYTFEHYTLRSNPMHRWVYYPGMSSNEILIFLQSKCLMERGGEGTEAAPSWKFTVTGDERPQSVFHTAVVDPSAPDGSQRDSCENRFVVFVPIDRHMRSAL